MNIKHLAVTAIALAGLSFGSVASAANHEIDPSHTFVVFKVKHLGIGYSYGMFRQTTGNIDPEKGTLDVKIDAKSIYTADKKRDEHLAGPDFFNVKEFPSITFKAKSMKKKGEGYQVSGDLTMKGKTQTVSFMLKKVGEGKDPWGNQRIGFEGSFTVNRMDFGVDYMPDGLSKQIEVMIAVEGIKK